MERCFLFDRHAVRRQITKLRANVQATTILMPLATVGVQPFQFRVAMSILVFQASSPFGGGKTVRETLSARL